MSACRQISVVLADDSKVLRDRVVAVLGQINGVEVVALVENGAQAVAAIRRFDPDVAVLDLELTERSGLSVLREIHPRAGRPLIVLLTNFPYPQYRRRAMDLGASHFFDKTTELDQLCELFKKLTGNADARPQVS